MNDYETATNEQLTEALDMAVYDIERHAKTRPEIAAAARQVLVKVKREINRRFRNGTK